MADADCPTQLCAAAKPCQRVKLGDVIDPNSDAHLRRNECNACPIKPPSPLYIRKRYKVPGTDWQVYERQVFTGYVDDLNNEWAPDNAVTAWWFHGDPFPGTRDDANMTFRVVPKGAVRGWQCRYVKGVLDDTSSQMGTYDYADAPSVNHTRMDVSPHNVNDKYVPNLTRQY